MKNSFVLILVCLLGPSLYSSAQKLSLSVIDSKTNASFRAVSVVDDSVVWVSGSNGWVGRSTNGGAVWDFSQVQGYEGFDFRSLYAFDKNKAIIANAGSPAHILITENAGKLWRQVYSHADTSAFIDGIAFWNSSEGIIYGDPLNDRMLLIFTHDGGNTWREPAQEKRPKLAEGEASFAASGTAIRSYGSQSVVIATGGVVSRLLIFENKGKTWRSINAPILQGKASTGIFSVSVSGKRLVIVGGDYLQDSLRTDHVFYSTDLGRSWKAPVSPTRGYRECVEQITSNMFIATGPTGTDISTDGGVNWRPLSDERYFHVVRKARKGKLIVMAGGKGKLAIIR